MNMHRNPKEIVTMTKEEASQVEKFAASAGELHINMQKVYQQFSTLSTQFSTILSRLEKLESKQSPPKTQIDPFMKEAMDFENGVGKYANGGRFS